MEILLESNNHNDTIIYDELQLPMRDYQNLTTTILCGISMGSILLNAYVLVSAKCLKKPVSFNLVLSLSLAASDGWSGLLIILQLLLNRIDIYYLLQPNDCILLTTEMLRLSSFSTSVFHLLALALNHFLGIVYPMQHKTLLHRRFEIAVLSFIWLVPPIVPFCFATFVPNQGFQSKDCENILFIQRSFGFRNVICAIIFIPMLITFGFYFAIVSSLRLAQRDPLLSTSRTIHKSSRKLFGTMVLLMGTFLLGWLPSILVYLLLCPDCPFAMDHFSMAFFVLLTLSFSLTILKLFSNPFIYALRIAELRRAMWQMTLICICKASLLRTVSQQSRRRISSAQFENDPNCSPFRSSPATKMFESPCMSRRSEKKQPTKAVLSKTSPDQVMIRLENNSTRTHLSPNML